jgi:hypothetical protein
MHATALHTTSSLSTPPTGRDAPRPHPVATVVRQSAHRTSVRDDEAAWARQAQASNGFGGF